MGKINMARVFLGGLLAGAVFMVLALAGSLIVGGEQLRTAVQAVRPLPTGSEALLYLIPVVFLFGIVAVWLYAAIRPRFGPGPKTAAIAGFAFWLMGGPHQTYVLGWLGQFPTGLVVTTMGLTLVEVIAATVAGAWPYKE